MTHSRLRSTPPRLLAGCAIALVLAACGGNQPSLAAPSPTLGPRPASPATVEILQPAASSTVSGTSVHVVLKLTGATIVSQTTTEIRPDQGHLAAQRDLDVFAPGEFEHRERVLDDLLRFDVSGAARHGEQLDLWRGACVQEGEAVVDAGVDVEQQRDSGGHGRES